MVLPNQKAEAPRWLTQRDPDDWVRYGTNQTQERSQAVRFGAHIGHS